MNAVPSTRDEHGSRADEQLACKLGQYAGCLFVCSSVFPISVRVLVVLMNRARMSLCAARDVR